MKKEPKPSPLPESVEEAAKAEAEQLYSCYPLPNDNWSYKAVRLAYSEGAKLGYQHHQAHNSAEPKWQLCPKCNGTGEIYINELYKNQTTGRVGYITCDVCGGAKILASPSSNSAEVERLREALKGIGNSAVYMINHEHQTVINSGLINHILETVNLALSQDALKEK